MSSNMNRINQLRQQIDACRAGSDDVHSPELADLARALGRGGAAAEPAIVREFDRAQRFDRNVVSALHDVAVPAGLLDKLLAQAAAPCGDAVAHPLSDAVTAAIQSSSQTACQTTIQLEAPPASSASAIVPAPIRRMPRRRALALAAGGLIAAAALGIAYLSWYVRPHRVSHSQLAADVQAWINVAAPGPWQAGQPPGDVAARFPATDLRRRSDSWQRLTTPRREGAVAYRIVPYGAERAWLFVVDTPHHYDVAIGPLTVLPGMSGGWAAGAWQRPGRLFVLVVERGRPLEDYLQRMKAA
jgi:hypothetical protein